MLKIDLRPGETVSIGNVAVITLEEKSGQIARLAIQADRSIPIHRAPKTTAAQIAARGGISGKT